MENMMEFVPVNITVIGIPQRLTVSYSNGSPVYYSYSNGVVKILQLKASPFRAGMDRKVYKVCIL